MCASKIIKIDLAISCGGMWTRNLAILQQLMQQQWEAARSLSQELMATGNVKTVKMLISLGGSTAFNATSGGGLKETKSFASMFAL